MLVVWDGRLGAFTIAVALFACLYLLVRRWANTTPVRDPAGDLASRRGRRLFLGCAALLLAVSAVVGQRGDYGAFRAIWRAVLQGTDPWFGRPLNAYGPLFNGLAPIALLHPMAPKVLFAFCYLALVAWMALVVVPRSRPGAAVWTVAILAVMNPFTWIELAYWGNFDILVAVTCVAAIDARVRQGDRALGAWLSTGILLKFFPVVLAPVLLLDRAGVRRRAALVCVGLLVAGFALSAAMWGTATWRPIAFAASRPSLDSVFSFLRGPISPLRLFSDRPNVDVLSTPLLAAASAAVVIWCLAYRVPPARAGLMAVLAALLFYRTGLTRYQMILFAVLAYWLVSDTDARPRWMRVWAIVYVTWVQFCDLAGWIDAVTYTGQTQPYAIVRVMRLVAGRGWGLVTFTMGAALLAGLARVRDVRVEPAPGVSSGHHR
jgi:hypothetical protein